MKRTQFEKEYFARYLNGEEWKSINDDVSVNGKSMSGVVCPLTFNITEKCSYMWKPKTFQINGIDVPVPMGDDLLHGEKYFIRLSDIKPGYAQITWCNSAQDFHRLNNGQAWALEDEIKQVIAADRSVLNIKG